MIYFNKLIFTFFTVIICSIGQVFSHSVQVQWCVSCTGDLRIWLEHWHGSEDPNSTTMTISISINGTSSTITSAPGGGVLQMTSGQLPGCSTPLAYAAGCPTEENTYNDWVYYDFPGLPVNVPLSFSIISGNTQFTMDCCDPCMYPLTVSFTIPIILIDDQDICLGDLTSTVNMDNSATWTNNNPSIGLPAFGTGSISPFTAIGSSGNTATITYDDACSVGSFDFTILPQLYLTSTESNYSGSNISCNGYSDGSIDIDVNGGSSPYSYNWSTLNPGSSDQFNLYAGSYDLQLTDAKGCVFDTTFLLTEPTPLQTTIVSTTDFNGYDISCNSYSDGGIDLSVSGSVPIYTYIWNNNATTQDITSLVSGSYSVDITDDNSCSISTYITLTEPTLLLLTSNFAHDTCNRKVGMAEVIISGGVFPYNYLWSDNQITHLINNLYGGNYSVIITDANNCKISEQFYIDLDIIEDPIAEFNVIPDLNIHHLYKQMDNPSLFIDKSVDEFTIITKWFWEFEDGFSSYNQENKHSFTEIGDFQVTLAIENFYGCVDTITKRIIVDEFFLYIPNSFTPQGDEINDIFLPKGLGIKNYELKIFSRWGEHFFTSIDLNIGWNGTTYKNYKIAQAGVYVYLINVIDVFGEKHTYSGQVTLII